MALIRRDNNGNDKAVTTTESDPFRTMLSWFGRGFEQAFSPAFEVKETKDSFQFKADLPGVSESDIDVKLTGNRLAITGKREAEHENKGDTFYTYERSYGTFQRAFMLPDGLDTEHVHAELKNGVLAITLPKMAMAQTKTIAVKAGDKAKS